MSFEVAATLSPSPKMLLQGTCCIQNAEYHNIDLCENGVAFHNEHMRFSTKAPSDVRVKYVFDQKWFTAYNFFSIHISVVALKHICFCVAFISDEAISMRWASAIQALLYEPL